MTSLSQIYLFGGDKPWSPLDWTASDDRVRGGSSISKLTCSPFDPVAVFEGNLDIKTLGGAGFASQRTIGEDRNWDLSQYDGLLLDIQKSDGKQYTVILKDDLLPKSPNGREQSTLSWEYDYKEDNGKVFVKWDELKATYRGREKKDTKPLDLKHIKRVSLMIRSFFGTQEGDFSLSIISIAATKSNSRKFKEPYRDDPEGQEVPKPISEKSDVASLSTAPRGWLGRITGYCVVS